ncbi:hypothetical protein D1872_89720 [compost metagenome]
MRRGYVTPEDYAKAEANGLDRKVVYHRVYHYGWDIERAITTPKRKKHTKEWGSWKPYYALMDKHGIDRKTFYTRVRKGMSPEEAATRPLIPRHEQAKVAAAARHANQKFPPEIRKLAEENGISKPLLYLRVRRGMSAMEAATKPKASKSEAGRAGGRASFKKYREGKRNDSIFG